MIISEILKRKIDWYIQRYNVYPTRIYLDVNSFNLLWEESVVEGNPTKVLKNSQPYFMGLPIYIVMTNLNLFVVSQYKFAPEHIEVA